ncbi:hypothetical protein EHI8A_007600 [Entamoeba histolytica HM-1:IMSS-B]|uniref:Uncharacterized protein n=6 Tax=Entamoeba histolytica TaxID=5759 RepID=C4M2G8_ENTH1|nr:hypothetical protein EHI_040390 [Entamoeba histolytica HM-1:IMSS]EMD43364.1 Hypothetical protein EHI5A_013570 [Entamoeba histolytica KU27]EMH74556.1 hypothetical protein EHI8A_007600 [Entamoeba histolytica HM-1:IMSS-B]EMS15292.1 hypothetical protein KM1_021620 [Entamoeba histolytica HM-3:IMSS]ENY61026.1 hypothetical protein EHI7A_010600 [Entamoeba histolytica HM-1:IMSS-A]GAT95470.1 hypothetical protein CL6EHI_040390 [Entamoeba histolytica]|eukprot:XP_651856.1 hypothetical protein EHI_040390 [Entamoeba histolytica HM-1:IMSS]
MNNETPLETTNDLKQLYEIIHNKINIEMRELEEMTKNLEKKKRDITELTQSYLIAKQNAEMEQKKVISEKKKNKSLKQITSINQQILSINEEIESWIKENNIDFDITSSDNTF